MARQTTKRKVETPENNAAVLEEIKREHGIDALRAELKRYESVITQSKAEIDRLYGVIMHKDIVINSLQKANEEISDQLSKARHDS